MYDHHPVPDEGIAREMREEANARRNAPQAMLDDIDAWDADEVTEGNRAPEVEVTTA